MDNNYVLALYPGAHGLAKLISYLKVANNIRKMQGFWRNIAKAQSELLRVYPSSAAQSFAQYFSDLSQSQAEGGPFSPLIGVDHALGPHLTELVQVKPSHLSSLTPFASGHDAQYAPPVYLPIENLRTENRPQLAGPLARQFLSSGTTQALRSHSLFSPEGLALYRAASLISFFYVLEQIAACDPRRLQGISLIPKVEVWPDSSLAQMLAWIADYTPLLYSAELSSSEDELPDQIQALCKSQPNKPIWIFGTAFHYINLLDKLAAAQKTCELPRGSLLFETGGTKGRSRELARSELFELLQKTFALPNAAIVSEYGMCELASQAYDWIGQPELKQHPASVRRFRFPHWVKTAVLSEPGKASQEGEGMLLIRDPLRCDFPYPLRTEDLARLDEQAFNLLGRAKSAPLKGCSLGAEVVMNAKELVTNQDTQNGSREINSEKSQVSRELRIEIDHLAARQRAEQLHHQFPQFLSRFDVRHALTEELGSAAGAIAALQDLQRSLPREAGSLYEAALRSAALAKDGASIEANWLFILPENHSIVACYPLCMAYVLGLQVRVRVPKAFAEDKSFLSLMLQFIASLSDLASHGPSFTRLESDFLLNADARNQPQQAVLCYGTDETIQQLKSFLGSSHLSGFGDRVGLSVLTAGEPDKISPDELEAWARDCLSLGQRGCMATRLSILALNTNGLLAIKALLSTLQKVAAAFWRAELPTGIRVGQELEAVRLRGLGFELMLPNSAEEPLLAFSQQQDFDSLLPETLHAAIARHPFVIPVIICPGQNRETSMAEMVSHFAQVSFIKSFTTNHTQKNMEAVANSNWPLLTLPLGDANAPIWNGLHDGRPLFLS